MAFEGNTGLQVATQYGARATGVSIGVEQSNDGYHQLSLELTGKGLQEGFTPPWVLPKGAMIVRAHVYVDEAFVGLTSVTVGQGGAEATNGIALLAADLAVGGKDVTNKLVGTWVANTPQTKAANIKFVKVGAVTNAGRASLVIQYLYKRRVDTEFKADKTTFPVYKAQPQV